MVATASTTENEHERVEDLSATQMLEKWVQRSRPSNRRSTLVDVSVRGRFDYAATAEPWSGGKRETHYVNHQLKITPTSLTGTFTDIAGTGTINGHIAEGGRTVSFIKAYRNPWYRSSPVWQYGGSFTTCGIEGEWHYPGDPPRDAFHRGKFALWLAEDESEQDQAQLATDDKDGSILTKSTTSE